MNKSGTIIYLGGFELPDKNAAAHRVINNAKILIELGYNIVFIGISHDLLDSKYNEIYVNEGFEYKEYNLKYPSNIIEWYKHLFSISHIKKIIMKYSDLKAVICYNFQAIPLIKLKKLSTKSDFKVISDITEWYGAQGNSLIKKMIKGFDSFFRMRIINLKLDGLILISKYLNDYYSIRYKNEKILQLPPLVDVNDIKFYTDKVNVNKNNKLFFVYSGSPGKNKDNLSIVLRAFNYLPRNFDFIFNVIGIGLEEHLKYNKEDVEIIKSLGKKVIFRGKLDHIASIEILKNSNFSIFYRDSNIVNKAGFPTKFVESISCGIPVITNSMSNISDFVDNGKNAYMIENITDLQILLTKIIESDAKNLDFDKTMFHYRKYLIQFEIFLNAVLKS